jgi:hypothetical protein
LVRALLSRYEFEAPDEVAQTAAAQAARAATEAANAALRSDLATTSKILAVTEAELSMTKVTSDVVGGSLTSCAAVVGSWTRSPV